MRKSDFYFELPEELVAQRPLAQRGGGRLLAIAGSTGQIRDLRFSDLPELLVPGDLLVFNDTRVIPARLFGHKDSGGAVELLVERILGETTVLAQIRASKPPRPGQEIDFGHGATARVHERRQAFWVVEFVVGGPVLQILDALGHVPLPPYITRPAATEDRDRYQTVYAQKSGAVAAPTAGLHFDEAMLHRVRSMGVQSVFLTLHVGAGTFQPMRVEDPADHVMHHEYVEISREVCDQVNATRSRGGRIIAVGTTTVRALESAAVDHELKPFAGDTDIFIYPDYRFHIVDAMITNFHLPESTLLMLVCAFAGTANVLAAYRHAVEERYRFFSYGDAMFVTKLQDASYKLQGKRSNS